MIRMVVLLNPRASKTARWAEIEATAATIGDVRFHEVASLDETARAVRAAVDEGIDLLVAAGGDGTIQSVVAAIGPDLDRVRLGLLPMGTGNDLARTLGVPLDPVQALEVLLEGRERRIDLVHVGFAGREACMVNLAAGGFSGQVGEVLTDEMKSTWGPLAFLLGATSALPDLRDYRTRIAWEDGSEESLDLVNVIVANGRTVGGGLVAAPAANPEDGLLDVGLIRNGGFFELAGLAARFVAGNVLDSDLVLHRRARSLSVVAEPGMWFSVDGELLTKERIEFRARPGALRVIVGPDYRPEGVPVDETRDAASPA